MNISIYITLLLINILLNSYTIYLLLLLLFFNLLSWIFNYYNEGDTYLFSFGYLLFLFYELLIFISLFFIYFYNSLSPSIEYSIQWLPLGIKNIDTLGIPLINTIILLNSGMILTGSYFINNRKFKLYYLEESIFLLFLFLSFQFSEYYLSSFIFSHSLFASSFFLLTSFHLFHVFLACLWSLFEYFFFFSFSFNFSSWLFLYSHYVDLIWLFLFIFIYIL